MTDENLEQWQQLCELASREQDPHHLIELIGMINRLLEEREQQLNHTRKQAKRCPD